MIGAYDLLDVAAELAEGRTPAHWGRAASTAYYAAFHCLVCTSMELCFGHPNDRLRAKAWMGHAPMSSVALAFAESPDLDTAEIGYTTEDWRRKVRQYRLETPPSEDVRFIARIFLGLQRRRLQADYFPDRDSPNLNQTEARRTVIDAGRLIQTVDRCAARPPNDDLVTMLSEMMRASLTTATRR